jgi:hypothetical protein
MERWFLTVESNCFDPSKEKKFSDWYNNIHLPDILEIPGFMHAAFYENTNPSEGQGKFLATYEIETDDLAQTLAKFDEIVNARAEQGRMSELGVAVGGGLYRQISAPVKKKKGKKK